MGFFKKIKSKVTDVVKESVGETVVNNVKSAASDAFPFLLTGGITLLGYFLTRDTPTKRLKASHSVHTVRITNNHYYFSDAERREFARGLFKDD